MFAFCCVNILNTGINNKPLLWAVVSRRIRDKHGAKIWRRSKTTPTRDRDVWVWAGGVFTRYFKTTRRNPAESPVSRTTPPPHVLSSGVPEHYHSISITCILETASFSEEPSPSETTEKMEWWIEMFRSSWLKSMIWRRTAEDRATSAGYLSPSAGSRLWRKVRMCSKICRRVAPESYEKKDADAFYLCTHYPVVPNSTWTSVVHRCFQQKLYTASFACCSVTISFHWN